MMRGKNPLLFAVIGVSAIGASLAFAGMKDAEENDAAALSQARISLTQAIAAAEQRVAGKAVRAGLEDENGKLVYGVEVLHGNQTTDVKVDSDNGGILSAQADRSDHEPGDRERGERDED
jgi:uncharacterized membrane protein YkoI